MLFQHQKKIIAAFGNLISFALPIILKSDMVVKLKYTVISLWWFFCESLSMVWNLIELKWGGILPYKWPQVHRYDCVSDGLNVLRRLRKLPVVQKAVKFLERSYYMVPLMLGFVYCWPNNCSPDTMMSHVLQFIGELLRYCTFKICMYHLLLLRKYPTCK